MDYVTIRATNLTNANGNDMGKVAEGVHYIIDAVQTKLINNVNRLLVSPNRYIPVNDVSLVTVVPPEPLLEKQRAIIQTWNGVEYVTTETWERIE